MSINLATEASQTIIVTFLFLFIFYCLLLDSALWREAGMWGRDIGEETCGIHVTFSSTEPPWHPFYLFLMYLLHYIIIFSNKTESLASHYLQHVVKCQISCFFHIFMFLLSQWFVLVSADILGWAFVTFFSLETLLSWGVEERLSLLPLHRLHPWVPKISDKRKTDGHLVSNPCSVAQNAISERRLFSQSNGRCTYICFSLKWSCF